MQFYAELLYIAAGFAAATFVSKWASDEGDGRLEMVLASPLARARWVVAGGASALLAIVVMTILFAAGIGLGSAVGGLPSGDAILGCAALGLYAAAIVGIGVAVGGLWRTSIAAEMAALVVVATYLLDLVAPPLKLPDFLHQLALSAHFGKPMVGQWDLGRRSSPASSSPSAGSCSVPGASGAATSTDHGTLRWRPSARPRSRAGPAPQPWPQRSVTVGPDGVARCPWGVERDPLYRDYHDLEWGRPSRDGRHLFEMLVLEGAQAGLAWSTILNKRAGYRRAFAGFNALAVAGFDDADVARLLADPGIVRNRLKVQAAIANARATLELGGEAALVDLVWAFVGGVPLDNRPASFGDVTAQTAESKAMSRELLRRGFRFVGPTICYAFMQACGLVNDHLVGCSAGAEIRATAPQRYP